jgi:hypothetical protein
MALLGACVTASPAQAAFTYGFSRDNHGNIFDPAAASLTLYDGSEAVAQGGDAGSVVISVTVNQPTYDAELFALYFNVAPTFGSFDSDTFNLSLLTPPDIAFYSVVNENSVNQVRSSATNVNPFGQFDMGVQFGRPGDEDILTVSFQIRRAGGGTLSAADFIAASPLQFNSDDVYFALRAQNTNINGNSWKLYANEDDLVNPVPAPGGLVLLATAAPFGFLYRRLRRKTSEVA